MKDDANNPYRSPREDCQAERAPEDQTPRSHVENIILAILHASAFLFSLLCFIYFAFAAVDLFRPRSIVEERLYASPPRTAADAHFRLCRIYHHGTAFPCYLGLPAVELVQNGRAMAN